MLLAIEQCVINSHSTSVFFKHDNKKLNAIYKVAPLSLPYSTLLHLVCLVVLGST